jgi:HemY protein
LLRAEKLARLAPYSPESKMAVASAALAAKNFAAARRALRPLVEGLEGQGQTTPGQGSEPPSARACLLMAELEDAEKGAVGEVRQWLARSARAPRDPIWVADGFMSDHWLPASPVTGELDAFVWQRPAERLGADLETAQKPLFSSNALLVIDHPTLPEAPGQDVLNGSQPVPTESDAEEITELNPSADVAHSEALRDIGDKAAKKLH